MGAYGFNSESNIREQLEVYRILRKKGKGIFFDSSNYNQASRYTQNQMEIIKNLVCARLHIVKALKLYNSKGLSNYYKNNRLQVVNSNIKIPEFFQNTGLKLNNFIKVIYTKDNEYFIQVVDKYGDLEMNNSKINSIISDFLSHEFRVN